MSLLDIFRSNKNAVNAVNDPASSDDTNQLVPVNNDIVLGQLLDALSGNGGGDLINNFYKPTFYGRNSAICYITLSRAVQLLGGVLSGMLENGYYRIVRDDGSEDTSRKAKNIRKLFSHTLNGRSPSSMTIADIVADYALDGNYLLVLQRNGLGDIVGMHRGISWSAQIKERTNRGDVYLIEDAEWQDGQMSEVPSTEVVHGRFPHLHRYQNYNSNRIGFALPPITLMRPRLEAGMALDNYILKYNKRSPYQNMNFSFNTDKDLTPAQKKEITDYIASQQAKEQNYFVTFNAKSEDITPKFNKDMVEQEDKITQEIARFYGIPAPLIGINLTQWGDSIAEMGRMVRNYSFGIHFQNVMAPIAFRCLNPGSHFELDYSKLLSADAAGVKNMCDALRGNAQSPSIATVEELRKIAGLPKEIDGELPDTITKNAEKPTESGNNAENRARLILPGDEKFEIPSWGAPGAM